MATDSHWSEAERHVAELLASEVPEIASGIIEVRALARTAGVRTKVAVSNNDPTRDPVRVCVGVDEVHIHRLSTLLDGELIDVVPWRDDPVRRVRMAVAPANVARLELDERQAIAHVTLRDDETARALVADLAHREIADRFAGWQLDLTIEHATA